jgi:precorrin-2 dehydrogenase/sirohydrochlorin ferrochelatase
MGKSELFPLFLKLDGRRCLVVGAGTVAESKIDSLLRAGAQVLVVAPAATPRVRTLAAEGRLQWRERVFADSDLAGACLAVAATNSEAGNEAVFDACRRQGILCNAVDDPSHCDFFYGAVVRRGALQIAISTGGSSPGLASRIRQELEAQFGPEYEPWLAHVAEQRRQILAAELPSDRKRAELERVSSRSSFEEFLATRNLNPAT